MGRFHEYLQRRTLAEVTDELIQRRLHLDDNAMDEEVTNVLRRYE